MKKLLAAVLVVLMAVMMIVPAFAANITPHIITITNTDSSVKHIYDAYQVFMGRLDATETEITNIEWGTGVDGAGLLAELQTMPDFASCTDAYEVAQVVAGFADNSAKLDEFATVVGKHLATRAGTSEAYNASPYYIAVVGDGYYFIKDRNDTVTANGESYSKYMLNVVKNVSIEAKDDTIVPDKKIVNPDSSLTSANAASIGDLVTFQTKIKIPNMNGYDNYIFTMNDTLCAGLCNPEIVSVTIGSDTAVLDEDYTVAIVPNQDGTTTMTVDFPHIIDYKGQSGYVTVNYRATVDTDAEIGTAGNPNTVNYTYSNNPNDASSTGTTPNSTTITYTTKVLIEKVDGSDNSKKLAGAVFELAGSALNTVITTGIRYEPTGYVAQEGEEIQEGTFYELNNGSFTKVAPTASTASHYASTTQTYVPVKFSTPVVSEENVTYESITGQSGIASFSGINAGQYTLTETLAPDGYNLLDEPINFTITWDAANGFQINSTNGTFVTEQDGTFKITIENFGGTPLPHTGGIGTTIFTIVGAVLAVGAAVALVSVVVSRRKENN